MAIVLSKIFAGIMSVVITLSGMFPALFGGKEFIDPSQGDVNAFRGLSFSGIGEATVIGDYEAFMEHFDAEEKEEAYKSFFEESNLVVIPVTLSSPVCKVFVESAAVKGDTVFVSYSVVRDGCIGLTVMSADVILIAVSKDITDVVATEKKVAVPFCVHKSAFSFDV